MGRLDVVPGGREAGCHGVAVVVGHVLVAVEHEATPGRGIRHERPADPRQEAGRRTGIRGAHRLGEGGRRTVGDALLEFAQQSLLPRLRIVDDRDRLRAELECGLGAPDRGIGGVESQHAPDPVVPTGRSGRYPQAQSTSLRTPPAWGGAGGPA